MEKSDTGVVRNVIRDYWTHTAAHPLFFGALIGVGICIQGATVTAPLFLKDFVDALANPGALDAVSRATAALTFFAFFSVIAWIFRRMQFYFIARLETRVMAELSVASFNYILSHSHHFFISNFVGSLVRRVTRYAKSYEVVMDAVLFQIYPMLLLAAGIVGVLFFRHPLLGLGLLAWLIIFILIQLTLIYRIHPYRLMAAEEDSKVTGALSDALMNQSTATLFSGLAYERKRFAEAIEVWRETSFRAWKYDDNIWAVQGVLILSVNIGLLFLALSLWKQGLITVGDFVLIQAYLLTLFERLVQASREMRHVFNAVAEATEMTDILRVPHEIRDVEGAVNLIVSRGVIEFKDVDFKYKEGPSTALRNFSLLVDGGEKIALVGPSGAGKTTVTKLLLRLYDVTSGSIRVDGQDIAHVTLESLRDQIAFVPQDPLLFHRSLMENIRYGRLDATDEEIYAAAKRAHCDEFILKLRYGYNTLVGERGIKLSGGERQRIAIARAILKDAPILVLDEATSSLDSETESLIQDALETLMEGKTVMVIAHRLSTIMKMDRIVVMENGRVSALGTHDELVAQGGRYRTLWNIQAGGFLASDEKRGDE